VPEGRGEGNLKEKALCTSQNKIREERCEGQHGFRASTTDRVQADQCAKRKVICLSNACAPSQVMEMLLAGARAVATRGVYLGTCERGFTFQSRKRRRLPVAGGPQALTAGPATVEPRTFSFRYVLRCSMLDCGVAADAPTASPLHGA
jgi:hypothetical protein